jgi:uncharacterized membrane protein
MMLGTIEIMAVILILVIAFVAIFLTILTKKKDTPENISANENPTINTHTAGKLMESKKLLDNGVITEEEFEEMKKEIMGK